MEELLSYYKNLLILQYADKPKALATIELLSGVALMDMLPVDLPDAFDIGTAEGVQLDLIGKFVGVQRRGRTFTGPIELNDTDFRSLIRIAIIKNTSDASLASIQQLLNEFFPQTLLVFDYQSMSLNYLFDAVIGTRNLAEMFVVNELLPKPTGVQLGALVYSNNINSFFGFRTYSLEGINNTGFNNYTDYQTDWPWMSYTDAVVV